LIFNDAARFGAIGGVGWDNPELNLPAAWGITDLNQSGGAFLSGGYTDILPAFATHPVYGGLSDVRFGVNSISSFAANVSDASFHSIFGAYNPAIFRPTEVMVNAGILDPGNFNIFGDNPAPGPDGSAITLIREEGLPDAGFTQKNHVGSLLVWPLIDNLTPGQSTIIEIANTDLGPNNVVLDCQMITHDFSGEPSPPTRFSKRDFRITLTPKEVFWWDTGRAKNGIPGFDGDKGFLFCWAVDGVFTRQEIDHDYLKGDAIVFGGGRAFQYNAIVHQAGTITPDRVLVLDGVEYSFGTSTIMFEGFVERFSGVNGVLAVAGMDIDFINSIQPTTNINFSCWNETEQGFSIDKSFYQFTQYDYGEDLELTIDDIFTPKFHCATTATIPLWAVAYEWTGGLAWGTNVFQDPKSGIPTAVVLPPVVQ
jgi:hypothetical protein